MIQCRDRRILSQKPGLGDGSRGGLLKPSRTFMTSLMPGWYELHQVMVAGSSDVIEKIGRA